MPGPSPRPAPAEWEQLYDNADPAWHLDAESAPDHQCRSLGEMIAAGEERKRLRAGDDCCSARDHGGVGCRCAHECHEGDPEHPFVEPRPF